MRKGGRQLHFVSIQKINREGLPGTTAPPHITGQIESFATGSNQGADSTTANKTGQLKELTWRVNDSGQFCQQMFSTEKEACDNNVIIKDKEGIYNSYNKANSKPGSPFIIMSGNPEGF